VSFKDFSRPNKEIKYFSRQPLKFKTFSRLYEPWNAYWRCVRVKKTWGRRGNLAKGGWWQFPNGKYAFKFERLENELRGTQTR